MSKFYQRVNLKYAESNQLETFRNMHGPFETDDELLADAVKYNLCGKEIFIFEGRLVTVPANQKELPEDEKREPGNEKNWRQVKGEDGQVKEWRCNTCEALILNARVAHPIWWSEGAGGGECKYEDIGYCPNCEKKPDFHGYPVTESGKRWDSQPAASSGSSLPVRALASLRKMMW